MRNRYCDRPRAGAIHVARSEENCVNATVPVAVTLRDQVDLPATESSRRAHHSGGPGRLVLHDSRDRDRKRISIWTGGSDDRHGNDVVIRRPEHRRARLGVADVRWLARIANETV